MRDPASALIVGAVEGIVLSNEERRFFEREAPSGVTLFKRNIPPSFTEFRKLIVDIQSTRVHESPPLVIAIDQEGGRVARLRSPFPEQGPPEKLVDGKKDEESLLFIENHAFIVGSSLKGLGVNVNFAPVVDIRTPSTVDAIGDRVYGSTAEDVCLRAGAYLSGLQSSGVYGCLKHFPGKGDASVDTHINSAVIKLSREELEARELVPYRRLLPNTKLVMVSHGIFPVFGQKEASRSPEIIGGLLRKDMGFKGVVVSDDMNMGAIPQAEKVWQDAIVEAVAAGVDMLLVCRHLERQIKALEALRNAAKKSRAFSARLEESSERMISFRKLL